MYFPKKQKPGLYHSRTNIPGAVVNKPGLLSFAPLFSRAPYTRKKRIPPDLSATLETFERFPQLSDTTPVVPKFLFTTRYRVMRQRSVNVGNKVSVCG